MFSKEKKGDPLPDSRSDETGEVNWKRELPEDEDKLKPKPSETRVKEREEIESKQRFVTFLRSTGIILLKVSRSLEILSWLGFAICAFGAGSKFQGGEWCEMIVMVALAVLFANNGIGLPKSSAARVAQQAYQKFTRIQG